MKEVWLLYPFFLDHGMNGHGSEKERFGKASGRTLAKNEKLV
jgi:hypothetical protein